MPGTKKERRVPFFQTRAKWPCNVWHTSTLLRLNPRVCLVPNQIQSALKQTQNGRAEGCRSAVPVFGCQLVSLKGPLVAGCCPTRSNTTAEAAPSMSPWPLPQLFEPFNRLGQEASTRPLDQTLAVCASRATPTQVRSWCRVRQRSTGRCCAPTHRRVAWLRKK